MHRLIRLSATLLLPLTVVVALAFQPGALAAPAAQPPAQEAAVIGNSPTGVALLGDRLYAGFGPRLVILDVSDPARLTPLGELAFPSDVVSVAVEGRYAYVLAGGLLRVIDGADPRRPVQVGALEAPSYGGMAVAGRYGYAVVQGVLAILDLADPSQPVEVGRYRPLGGISTVTVAGTYGYLSSSAGLRVVSLAEPASPREVGFAPRPAAGALWDVAVTGRWAYAASIFGRYTGLVQFDVSDPSRPDASPLARPATTVAAGPTRVVAADRGDAFGGFVTVIDSGGPAGPRVGPARRTAWNPVALAVGERHAYVRGNGGLHVLDIGDPAQPTEVAFYTPAPPLAHDERYFPETRFRIDDDQIWAFFQTRGGLDIFGFPVSRTFLFLGCPVQVFQRQIAQACPGRDVAFMNVLDPDIFPFTRINFSTFPAPDEALKAATPKVGSPDYATRILDFVRANAPDTWNGRPVNFRNTFFNTVSPEMAGTSDPGLLGLLNLEVWGAPISRPAPDPNNANFIYQRFQRGIMHYTAGQGTRGILLADYLKSILLGPVLAPTYGAMLPADLAAQAAGSRTFGQYCPGAPSWLCRPSELPGTDLSFAFEPG